MNGNIIKIDGSLKQKLLDLAQKTYPSECCAVQFSNRDGSIDDICVVANKSGKGSSFIIDPLELFECEKDFRKRGYEITGFFHSHPDTPAVMSEEDEKNAIPGMLYLLAPVTREGCGRMRLWRKDISKGA